METSSIISLISVGLAIITTLILGVVVFLSNRKSSTNRTFLFLSLIIIVWSFLNFLSYQFSSPESVLWILRLVIFSAVWFAFFVFALFYVAPYEKISFPKWYKFILLPVVVLVSLSTLTTLVFNGIAEMAVMGGAAKVINGPGIAVFGLSVIGLVVSGFVILVRKILNKKDAERRQLVLLLIGALTFVVFVLIFNFILPAFFDNPNFIPFSAIFTFPFIAFTSYAILKHGLFNVKVIATQLLVFVIWIVISVGLLLAESMRERLLDGSILVFTVIAGIFLIKSVKKEVSQREEIEQLAGRLKSVNRIMSHDIKNVLGKNKDMFGMLLDGSFGAPAEKAKPFLEQANYDTKKLIRSVIIILESGQDLVLKPEPFDLKEAVLEVVHDEEQGAKGKGLSLVTDIDEKETYTIVGGRAHIIAHVLRNLVENAINYTLEGSVTVGLFRKDANTLLFSVKDTGIGISNEDKPNIFKEGGHGKDSIKTNVHSTGYGLFSVKRIVDAHGGKVWFETEEGKGTTFFVELEGKG